MKHTKTNITYEPLTHVPCVAMKENHSGYMIAVIWLLDEEHVYFKAIFVGYLNALIRQLVVARLEHKDAGIGWIIGIVEQQILRTVEYTCNVNQTSNATVDMEHWHTASR